MRVVVNLVAMLGNNMSVQSQVTVKELGKRNGKSVSYGQNKGKLKKNRFSFVESNVLARERSAK